MSDDYGKYNLECAYKTIYVKGATCGTGITLVSQSVASDTPHDLIYDNEKVC